MCNHIGMEEIEIIELKERKKELKKLNKIRRHANGFDYSDWPIIKPKMGGQDWDIEYAHWEFIPSWVNSWEQVKESRKKFTTLNATCERLFESKMYKDAALKRRCLIPVSGFYEWRHYKPEYSKKDIAYPYYISLPDKQYFFLAGIWQPWTDKETGETIDTFSIVTTKANDLMEQVHNVKKRMPTILPEDLAVEWIKDGLTQERITQIASFQYDSEEMSAWSIKKDFKLQPDPTEEFEYEELPVLQ
jgi:putative SOS response-associated peptidase YedK